MIKQSLIRKSVASAVGIDMICLPFFLSKNDAFLSLSVGRLDFSLDICLPTRASNKQFSSLQMGVIRQIPVNFRRFSFSDMSAY